MSVFNTSRLVNKTVLVTGASGGIGKEAAILFAKAGCNVILTARRLPQLKEAASECTQNLPSGSTAKIIPLELDVRDKKSVEGVLGRIGETEGGKGLDVDILVNNAGLVFGVERVGDISMDDVETMFDTNVKGLINLTQVVVREFKKRNTGHVINLGSVAGREPYPGGAIYCATKAALRAFSGSLLRELIATNIRVSEIQPGMVETNFSVTRFRGDQSAADKVYQGMEPLTAVDIAEEIVWVASRPPRVNIAELYVLPSAQGSAGLVHRST